jgi:hypothetical protein
MLASGVQVILVDFQVYPSSWVSVVRTVEM